MKNCVYCNEELHFPFVKRKNQYCDRACINKKFKIGFKHSDRTKKLLSEKLKGKPAWNKGFSREDYFNVYGKYYNHKVVSIEFVGKEDVYNITVDDNHNYFVVTNYRDDMSLTGVCLANCSESVLYDGEQCCLGSINLVRHLSRDNKIDWDKLSITVKLSIRFLDNMIDKSNYPSSEVKKIVLKTRKIGLGIMGFADMLILMGIKYSDKKSIKVAGQIISFIRDIAEQESKKIGKEKGYYLECKERCPKRRNAIILTLAPTGTISLIAGVSSGIEPNFAKSYSRMIYPENKIVQIDNSLKDSVYFETSYDIPAEHHLDILATFQKHVDNSISKTVNVPELTTVDDIKNLILKAHSLGVKGLTIFRKNCSRKSLIKCDGDTCQL